MKELTYFEQVERMKEEYEKAHAAMFYAIQEFFIQEDIMLWYEIGGTVDSRENVVSRFADPEKYCDRFKDDKDLYERRLKLIKEDMEYAKERTIKRVVEILERGDVFNLEDVCE